MNQVANTAMGAAATAGSFLAAGLVFDVPESWKSVPPRTSMRIAEYQLPGDAGPAELTVFAFPPGQGGSVDANINRWAGQFKTPDGGTPETKRRTLETHGLKAYVVQTEGSYTPTSMGPMAPKQPPKAGQALYGVIVEGGPQGMVFVKVAGPEATVKQHAAELDAMTNSVHAAK